MRNVYLAAIAAIFSLPVAAKPILEVDSGDAVIQIHNDQGKLCQGVAMYAEYIPKSPNDQRVKGCWTASGPFIFVVFLDGDTARIPREVMTEPKEA